MGTVPSVPEPEAATACERVVGRYAMYGTIASGGMATVHYGRLLGPVGFSRTVAIKRLRPQFAEDPHFVTMFLDEAKLAARIRHPNVVATLDVIAEAKEILLVMDYVHGESLARILRAVGEREASVPLPVALRIASDVLQGLHAAHETHDEDGKPLNIVHRDISPQNILIGSDGIARLVDFGVAKAAGRAQHSREGQLKGKLGYMAPEQLMANTPVTRQADIHAFATVFWEMLTGRRLFVGDSEADTVARIVRHDVPALSQSSLARGLPPAVDEVLRMGLAPDVEVRFSTALAMCAALDSCGPMATSMQVADWMQGQIGDAMRERTAVVRTIERDPASSPAEGGAKDDANDGTKKRVTSRGPGAIGSTGFKSAPVPRAPVDPNTSTLPPPPDEVAALPLAPSGLVWAAAVAGALLVAGTLWSLAARVRGHSEAVATAGMATTTPPASSSLTAAPRPPSLADSGSATPAASAAAADAGTPAESTTAPRAAAPPVNPPAGRQGTKKPKINCSPPFMTDAQGVRVPKRECFR